MMLFKRIAARALIVLLLLALTTGCRSIALEDTFDPGGPSAPTPTSPGDVVVPPGDPQAGGQTDAGQPGGSAEGTDGAGQAGGAVEQPGSAEAGQPGAGSETAGGETPPPAEGEGGAGAETATPQPAEPGAETAAPAGRVIHTIQSGETIGRIAQAYGVSIESIARVNNLDNVNRITAGDTLEIPTPAEAAAIDADVPPPTPTPEPVAGFDPNRFINHTVRPGETLFTIGRAYGFTVEELAAFNNLENARLIYGGQVLKIPVR